jgi:protein TonB
MGSMSFDRDRLQASVGVAAVHALLAYALLTGLAPQVARSVGESLKLFDVTPPPPPPPPVPPPKADTAAEDGAASAPNLKARPTPVVAPPPLIRLKPPPVLRTAPKAAPLPPGRDASAGNAAVVGPGTGAGGSGVGSGSGGSGTGAGGGGGGSRAERISGRLANEDYPRSALRAGAEGSVSVRYTVGTDGRVSGCTVTRSSGHSELDSTTCALIERRFRYRPARNSEGEPAPETVRKTFDWLLPFKAARGGS